MRLGVVDQPFRRIHIIHKQIFQSHNLAPSPLPRRTFLETDPSGPDIKSPVPLHATINANKTRIARGEELEHLLVRFDQKSQ